MSASAFSVVSQKLRLALTEYRLLEGTSSVLVAFSGGSDSTLLLSLLASFDGLAVAAAHFHHGIRGDEADRDEAFCRRFCDERGIRLYVGHADIPALAAATNRGLEETARSERYAFLETIAAQNRYDAVATAHNADDNLETILFHLIRGAGLDGLTGIPPRRGNIIRPLLLCRKDEIEAACREAALPFVIDSTNTDTAYSRNYIRTEIVPRLKLLNPAVIDTASDTARLLRNDCNFLRTQADRYSLADGRQALAALDDALLSRVLRREFSSRASSPSAHHIATAIDAIRAPAPHLRISLPRLTLICDRDRVSVVTAGETSSGDFCQPLHAGINCLPNGTLLYLGISDLCKEDEINRLKNIYKFAIQATMDSATIEQGVLARSRRPGDRYSLRGMTRRVKKLLQESKKTLSERQALPLLVSKDGTVLWIPGLPPADSAAPRYGKSTVSILFCDTTKG